MAPPSMPEGLREPRCADFINSEATAKISGGPSSRCRKPAGWATLLLAAPSPSRTADR